MATKATHIGDPYIFGSRLPLLRRLAGGIGQERLSEEIGERKGLVSWYEALGSTNAPKAVNAEHAWKLSAALAGQSRVVEDAEAIFRFLLGLENDITTVDQGNRENNNSQRFPGITLRPYLPEFSSYPLVSTYN